MLSCAARRSDSDDVRYSLYVVPREGAGVRPVLQGLRAVCGPGDTAEPVITIMLPNES